MLRPCLSFCVISRTHVPSLCHHAWHIPISHPSLSPYSFCSQGPATSPLLQPQPCPPPCLLSPPCLRAPWSHTHFLCLCRLATFPSSVPSESQIPVALPPSGLSLCQPCPCCSLSFPLPAPGPTAPSQPSVPREKPRLHGARLREALHRVLSLYKHHVVHTHCKPYTCSACGKTCRRPPPWPCTSAAPTAKLEATEESEQALYEQQQPRG